MAKKTLFIFLLGLLALSSSSCALLLDPFPGPHHHGHYGHYDNHRQHNHYEHHRYDSRKRTRRHH